MPDLCNPYLDSHPNQALSLLQQLCRQPSVAAQGLGMTEMADLWGSPPFEPILHEEKLYARGVSDNKGEIATRLAAILALRASLGELPITIRWIIEGEEEIGSPHFAALSDQPDMDDIMQEAYGIDRFVDGLTGLPLRERQAFSPTSNIAGLLSGYTGQGVKTVLPAHAMAKMDFCLVPD